MTTDEMVFVCAKRFALREKLKVQKRGRKQGIGGYKIGVLKQKQIM
jgi:hypothetical protein